MILAPRHLPRLAATVGLFTRYGLQDFARRQGLIGLVPAEEAASESGGDAAVVADRANAFRRRLVELGPAYVKLGQVLSTRPDLLPEPYIRELEHLQDDVGPVPFEDIERTIEEELGARVNKLFGSFEREPLASASLGQVHVATLRDGREVVVKVQRPGIRPGLADDILFFRELASFLTAHTAAGARLDMIGVIKQLERALAEELDYRTEARNAASVRRSMADFPHLVIPRVIEGYTTERVLTTERVRGVKVGDIAPLARIEHDFSAIADEFATGYLKQITIDGHFHADPHPGNVFVLLPGSPNPATPADLVAANRRSEPREGVTPLARIETQAHAQVRTAGTRPAAEDEPRLAIIDFGMTARLSPAMRDQIVRLLLDLAENRGESAAELLIELGQPTEAFDRSAYVRETASLIANNHDLAIGEIDAGTVLQEMITIAFRHGLRLPAELTLLAKTLLSLDGVTKALDPTYSPVAAIRRFTLQIMDDRARRELSPQRMMQLASQTSSLLQELPHRIDVFTQRLAANDVAVRVESPQLGTLLPGLQKVANRIFTGLVLGGTVVASAMLYPHQRQLGTTGFVLAAALGLYMVITMLVSDRKERARR